MKKLYSSSPNKNKGPTNPSRVHPSSSSSSSCINPLSSLLPSALLTLAVALSPEEQEVLAYLLSSQQKHHQNQNQQQMKNNNKNNNNRKQQQLKNKNNNQNHPPDLGCSCFGCYKSIWVRWDASPNRHVIHLILDAFEETLESKSRDKRATKKKIRRSEKLADDDGDVVVGADQHMATAALEKNNNKDAHAHAHAHDDDAYDGYGDDDDDEEEEEEEIEMEEGKSPVRRFVSWVFGIGGN